MAIRQKSSLPGDVRELVNMRAWRYQPCALVKRDSARPSRCAKGRRTSWTLFKEWQAVPCSIARERCRAGLHRRR